MGDETPRGTRSRKWYEYRPGDEGIGPFAVYEKTEWEAEVDAAKAANKVDQLHHFMECVDEFDSFLAGGIQEAINQDLPIEDKEVVEARRLAYRVKLFYDLAAPSDTNQTICERVRTAIREVQLHHLAHTRAAEAAVVEESKRAAAAATALSEEQKSEEDASRSSSAAGHTSPAAGHTSPTTRLAPEKTDMPRSRSQEEENEIQRLGNQVNRLRLQYENKNRERENTMRQYEEGAVGGDRREYNDIGGSGLPPRGDGTRKREVIEFTPRSQTSRTDRRVEAVLDDFVLITRDPDYQPLQPLGELIIDIAKGGLVPSGDPQLACLLTRFGLHRFQQLCHLLTKYQKKHCSSFGNQVLEVVLEIADDFGSFATMPSLQVQQPTEGRRLSAEESTARYSTPMPLQHLRNRPAPSFGAPFDRFPGANIPGQGLFRMAGVVQPPQPSVYDTPLARLVGTPQSQRPMAQTFPGPRSPLPGMGGVMPPPTSFPENFPRAESASAPEQDAYYPLPARQLGTPRFEPSIDASATRTPLGRASQRAPTWEERRPGTIGAATAREVEQTEDPHRTMMRLMTKFADRLDAMGEGSGTRSTTRIKFPDFRASTFHGDETKFLPWLVEFTDMLKLDKNLSDHAKVTLLKMHLSSEVKEQLRFTSSDTLPYEECMAILLAKFARPYAVQRSYRRKLQNMTGPSSANDFKGLDRMIMQTKMITNALELLGQSTDQVGVLIQDVLLDKLPNGMYSSFIQFAFHQTGRDPKALDVTQLMGIMEVFAQLQDDVQTHNRTDRNTNRPDMSGENRRRSGGRGREERSGGQGRDEKSSDRQTTMATTNDNPRRAKYCALCQSRDHWADGCKKYVSPDERRERFVELKLCFKCGKPHSGGLAACTSTWRCGAQLNEQRCTRNHHICLHEWYMNRAAGGPPEGGNRQNADRGRSQSGDRSSSRNGDRGKGGDRERSGDRGRSRSQSHDRRAVRFVDEKDRKSGNSGSRD